MSATAMPGSAPRMIYALRGGEGSVPTCYAVSADRMRGSWWLIGVWVVALCPVVDAPHGEATEAAPIGSRRGVGRKVFRRLCWTQLGARLYITVRLWRLGRGLSGLWAEVASILPKAQALTYPPPDGPPPGPERPR